MPRKLATQGKSSKRQQGRVDRTRQAELFQCLGIEHDTQDQATVVSKIREAYKSVGFVDLRSSISRRKVRQAIRDRMDQMPATIQDNEDRDGAVEVLYRLILALKTSWNSQTDQQSQQPQPLDEPRQERSTQPERQRQAAQPQNQQEQEQEQRFQSAPPSQRGSLDISGPSVVPDADVQIIRADDPDRPLPIRLSDLLPDANDCSIRSTDGGWINASMMRIEPFRKHLQEEGYLKPEGERLWFNPHALSELDVTEISAPHVGETRLTPWNFASTVQRAMDTQYPTHRDPSPDPDGKPPRLCRPSFTIIVRADRALGGVLASDQSVRSCRRTSSLTRDSSPRSSRHSRPPATPASLQSASEQQNVSQEAIVEERAQHLDEITLVPLPANGSPHIPSTQTKHLATQPTTGDKRREPATENDLSERPPQRRRLGSDAPPGREGLRQLSQEHDDNQRTSISSPPSRRVSQTISKTSRSHSQFRHTLAVEIESTQRTSRIPPTADEPSYISSQPLPATSQPSVESQRLPEEVQERPGEFRHPISNEVHESVGHAWIPHDRFQPPEVQRAVNSQQFTREISQLTGNIDLTGEVGEPSSSIQHSAVEAQKVARENERLAQETNRQFSERQQRPPEIQSSSSESQPPTSAGKSSVSEGQLPAEENPWLAGQIHWMTRDMYRMTNVKRPPSISVSPRTRVGSCYRGQ